MEQDKSSSLAQASIRYVSIYGGISQMCSFGRSIIRQRSATKRASFPEIGGERLHFVAVDLNAALDGETLIKSGFDPAQRTFWIAEGLLMYLPADIVSSLMTTLKSLSASGSELAFTFMERQSDGRIRFHSQSKLVDWWLRERSEPFVWGTTRGELVDLMRPWRVIRFFDHDNLRELRPGLVDEPIAKGEAICLAEI